MAATTTVTVEGLVVPALTDNNYWFVNAAAWAAYWLQAGFSVTFAVADTVTYGLVKAANTAAYVPVPPPAAALVYAVQTTDNDGNPITINIVDSTYVNELAATLAALDANYKNLKAALIAAGIANN